MRFAMTELHQDDGFGNLKAHEEFGPDLVEAVLEEAARLCQQVLLPVNRSGDEEGCHFEQGPDGTTVTTPKGFQDAYRQFAEGAGPRWSPRPNGAARACPRRWARWWRK
jgi:hypothetical protein